MLIQKKSQTAAALKKISTILTGEKHFASSKGELHKLLFSENKEILLDNSNSFAILEASYFKELKQRSKDVEKEINTLLEQITQQNQISVQKKNLIDIHNKHIQLMLSKSLQYKQKVKQYSEKMDSLLQQIKTKDSIIEKLKSKYEELLYKKNSEEAYSQYLISRQRSIPMSQFAQTQFDIGLRKCSVCSCVLSELNSQSQKVEEKAAKKSQVSQFEQSLAQRYQKQIEELKRKFEIILKEINEKSNEKIQQIEKSVLNFEKWSHENKALKEENEALRQKIRIVDEKDEKIKQWKMALKGFIQNIENDYNMIKGMSNIDFLKAKIQELERKKFTEMTFKENLYLEKQLTLVKGIVDKLETEEKEKSKRLNDIKFLLESPSEIPNLQENIINVLLTSSSKIKQIVKFLMQQI